MKQKIDYTDPIFDLYKIKCYEALDSTLELEKSTLPIYAVLKNNKPEHIGTGVLINIKSKFFIFSASHVFDEIGDDPLSIGLGKGRKLLTFGGDRFSTARDKTGKHQYDPIDASVFPVTVDLPKDIKEQALSYKDLDLSENDDNNDIHIIAGYRIKKSYAIGNQSYGKAQAFPSIKLKLKDYSLYKKLDKELHIALAYESYNIINGIKQKTPKLTGMSGGGIFRSKEIRIPASSNIDIIRKPLLSAITIGYEPKRHNREGIVIGTKIHVHLSLIQKYLPGLL